METKEFELERAVATRPCQPRGSAKCFRFLDVSEEYSL